MTEPGKYMSYGLRVSDDQAVKGSGRTGRFPQREAGGEPQAPEVEREERRLARLRLVTLPQRNVWEDEDDPDPQAAA